MGFRYGSGHRRAAVRRAGVVAALAAGVLVGGGSVRVALAAPCCDGAPAGSQEAADQDEEPEPAAPSHGSNHGLLIIDNSNADSWLEVDRTLNTLLDSQGTAGSDHDGDGDDGNNGHDGSNGSGSNGDEGNGSNGSGSDHAVDTAAVPREGAP